MTVTFESSFLGIDWGAVGVLVAAVGLAVAAYQLRQLVLATRPPNVILSWKRPPDVARLARGGAGGNCTLRVSLRNVGPGVVSVIRLTMRPRVVFPVDVATETAMLDAAGLALNTLDIESRLIADWHFGWERYDGLWSLGSAVTEGVSILTLLADETVDLPALDLRIIRPEAGVDAFRHTPALHLVFNIHTDRRSYAQRIELPLVEE